MHVWMTLGCKKDSKVIKPIDRERLEVAHGLKTVSGGYGLSGEAEKSRLFGQVDIWELM